jgi:Ca-activated chloride channel family protein
MTYTRWVFNSTLVVLALIFPAFSQLPTYNPPPVNSFASAAPATDGSDDTVLTIRKRVDEVNVLFIATDKHGKFVRNLNQNDFTYLDDHRAPEAIINFRREINLPIQLGLLIDTSGSVDSRFAFEQEAAVNFLQRTVRAGFDSAFVMGFSSRSTIAQDFTDNVKLLETSVHSLRNGGGTALYDAIVIVSDGNDNQSEYSRAQAIEMAQRAEVIIYAISTDDSGLIVRGDKVLEQLAEATGGRAFFPYKTKDVTRSFTAIEDELRSQYVVSYRPANFDADGRFRAIEISALKKDLQVRARKGYFAPKQ